MTLLQAIGVAALGVSGIFFVIAAMSKAIDLITDHTSTNSYQRIKFTQFIHLSSIAPDKWDMYSNHVTYYSPGEFYENFSFSFPDLIRYRRYYKLDEKRKNDLRNSKRMRKMVELWQADIDEYKQKHGIGGD